MPPKLLEERLEEPWKLPDVSFSPCFNRNAFDFSKEHNINVRRRQLCFQLNKSKHENKKTGYIIGDKGYKVLKSNCDQLNQQKSINILHWVTILNSSIKFISFNKN